MSETFLAVTCKLDIVALEPQSPTNRFAERLIVVDYDYPGWHLAPLPFTVVSRHIQPRLDEPTRRER